MPDRFYLQEDGQEAEPILPDLSGTISSGPTRDFLVQPTYKASLYAEQQKFGSSKRDQLVLWPPEPENTEVTISGLDLTVSEDKALSAIQILLDRTGYQGNRPGEEIYSEAFHWKGTPPRLAVSHSDFFKAYGLEKQGDQYQGHQAVEALQALRSLATVPRNIYYERRHWTGSGRERRQLSDIIKARSPLVKLTELTAYQDLEQEEARQVKAGQDVPEKARATGLLIEFSPLLVDGVQDFFILKPTKLHKEIQALYGNKRPSRAVSLFIQWLMTYDHSPAEIYKENLAEKLRLDWYIKNRRKSELEARLQEAFRTAKELGYLLDYHQKVTGALVFELNPEKCSRVKAKRARTKKAEEEKK